jgi:hypothetical protein
MRQGVNAMSKAITLGKADGMTSCQAPDKSVNARDRGMGICVSVGCGMRAGASN